MFYGVAQLCPLQLEDCHEAVQLILLVHGVVVVVHNFGNEGFAFCYVYITTAVQLIHALRYILSSFVTTLS